MEASEDAMELAGILRRAVAGMLEGADEPALMFSGGLDSATIAIIARKRANVHAYVAGLEDSPDILWARECAAIIDLDLTELAFSEDDVLRSLENVVRRHRMTEPRWMSTFVAHDLVFGRIPEATVMSGQGADEVFGGYAKYLREADPAARMAHDVKNLLEMEMPAYRSMAGNHGKSLLAPFLEPEIVAFASGVPVGRKLGETGNKIILREAAMFLGTPGMMAGRRKKAMQYGTGVSKVIKKHLREEGIGLRELIDSMAI